MYFENYQKGGKFQSTCIVFISDLTLYQNIKL